MKKTILTLGLFSALVINANASSFTHEARFERHADEEYSQLEWTLAKGSYNITDNLDFIFDVDKDIYFDSNKEHGWDTKFGVHRRLGATPTFLNKEWSSKLVFEVEYDNAIGSNDDKVFEDVNYTAAVSFNTQTENGWDILLTPKFKYDQKPLSDKDGYQFELNTQLYKDLGAGFDFYAEIYQYYRIDGDYYAGSGYALDYEQYITYTKQLGQSPLYFWTEFGVEGYEMFSTYTDAEIDIYLNPQLQFRTTIKDTMKLTTYVGATMYDGTWSGNNSANGDLEYQAGLKFSAKF